MWSNKKPEQDGYYWLLEKKFEDDNLKHQYKSIVYLSIETWDDGSKHINIASTGSDDDSGLPYKDSMIIETKEPKERIFMFDSDEDTAGTLTKGYCEIRWEFWIKPIQTPSLVNDGIEPYEVLHQKGMMSVEMDIPKGGYIGDVGIQIARDGRIWLC